MCEQGGDRTQSNSDSTRGFSLGILWRWMPEATSAADYITSQGIVETELWIQYWNFRFVSLHLANILRTRQTHQSTPMPIRMVYTKKASKAGP